MMRYLSVLLFTFSSTQDLLGAGAGEETALCQIPFLFSQQHKSLLEQVAPAPCAATFDAALAPAPGTTACLAGTGTDGDAAAAGVAGVAAGCDLCERARFEPDSKRRCDIEHMIQRNTRHDCYASTMLEHNIDMLARCLHHVLTCSSPFLGLALFARPCRAYLVAAVLLQDLISCPPQSRHVRASESPPRMPPLSLPILSCAYPLRLPLRFLVSRPYFVFFLLSFGFGKRKRKRKARKKENKMKRKDGDATLDLWLQKVCS